MGAKEGNKRYMIEKEKEKNRFVILLSVTAIVILSSRSLKVANCLKMLNLDVPSSTFKGQTIILSCSFVLSPSFATNPTNNNSSHDTKHLANDYQAIPEKVYSIKWYKDGKEFYRYLNFNSVNKREFATTGIQVDLDKSDGKTVVLRNVSLETSALYKCEVSTDAPFFTTKFIEKQMDVFSIPSAGPVMKSNQISNSYELNSFVNLTCTSNKSKPSATLDWIIGDKLNLTKWIKSNKPLFVPFSYFETIHTTHIHQDTNNKQESISSQQLHVSISRLSFRITDEVLYFIGKNTDPNYKHHQTKQRLLKYVENQGPNEDIWIVHIKCIARLLHISMSDEIKLRVRWKKNSSEQQPPKSGQQIGGNQLESSMTYERKNTAYAVWVSNFLIISSILMTLYSFKELL